MKDNVLILKEITLMDLRMKRYDTDVSECMHDTNISEKNYIEGEQMTKQMGQHVND